MKFIIAIKACRLSRDFALREAQRQTWIQHSSIPVKWFVGNGSKQVEENVIQLDCGDRYEDLISKTRAMASWIVNETDCDYAVFTDTDTFICVDKLLSSEFEQHDYVGWTRGRTYAQGGCYILSRKAMNVLIADTEPTPETIWEDFHVGTVLARHGIYPSHDERYLVGPADVHRDTPTKTNAIISLHKLTTPQAMNKVYTKWLNS